MKVDSLLLADDIKRLTIPYQPVAEAYLEADDKTSYEAGYAIGYAQAIKDVLSLLKSPMPPKSFGHPDWDKTIQTALGNAPSCIPRDKDGVPYVQ